MLVQCRAKLISSRGPPCIYKEEGRVAGGGRKVPAPWEYSRDREAQHYYLAACSLAAKQVESRSN